MPINALLKLLFLFKLQYQVILDSKKKKSRVTTYIMVSYGKDKTGKPISFSHINENSYFMLHFLLVPLTIRDNLLDFLK